MPPLKRRTTQEEIIKEIETEIENPLIELPKKEYDMTRAISTGSTLLDLTISGGRNHEGGIPGGIIIEVAGPSASGKTAILSSIAANIQLNKGQVMFLDPEARFDQEYARIYGILLQSENYFRPNIVEEVFEKIYNWIPIDSSKINGICIDSLAALSTELEMDDRDKYGMRRAKMFSEGLRKTARIISDKNWIVVCSNQQRDGEFGPTTPGGQAIKYYCSLRISAKQVKKIEKEKDFHGKKISRVLGIETQCTIVKSSIDNPYRKCNISIIFNKGIDTIRDELIFYKTVMNETVYDCFGKSYQSIDKAILYIEQNNLKNKLKTRTIELWNEMESLF